MPESEIEALVAAVGARTAARAVEDLKRIGGLLPWERLRAEYVKPMLRGEKGAVSELFAVARVSGHADAVEPHASGRGRRRCDALVTFDDLDVFVEVKHQRDTFPFNSPGTQVSEGVTFHAGSRPGADPRFTDSAPPATTDPLPAASIWRGTLEEAAAQLPRDRSGLILVSCDAHLGLDEDTAAAVRGDATVVARPHPQGWGSIMEEQRLANGFFHEDRHDHVAGVWFFRLSDSREGRSTDLRCDWARGYVNWKHPGPALPDRLAFGLPNVIGTHD